MFYTFDNADETTILCVDEDGKTSLIPVYPGNRAYNTLIESNVTIAPYVEPPALPEPTPEEKLARSGLTVDELKDLLGL